jgi:hypothetical protein
MSIREMRPFVNPEIRPDFRSGLLVGNIGTTTWGYPTPDRFGAEHEGRILAAQAR